MAEKITNSPYEIFVNCVYGLIGLICILFAETISLNLGVILGLILLIGAILSFINFFISKPYLVGLYGGLMQSFAILFASILCFIFAQQAFRFITVVIGIIALISGLTNFVVAIINAWMKEHCLWDILDAICQSVLGILLISNAQGLIYTIIIVFGIYLLVKAIIQICVVLYKDAYRKKYQEKNQLDPIDIEEYVVHTEQIKEKNEQ